MKSHLMSIIVLGLILVAAVAGLAQIAPSPIGQALQAHGAGDHAGAIALWEEAVQADPENTGVRTNLARCLIETGSLDRAEEELAAVLDRESSRPSAHNLLGRIHRLRGDFETALADFERAIAGAPEQGWYHNNLGYTLINLGRFRDATAPLEEAVALDAEQPFFWNNLGFARLHGGDPERARTAFVRALELNPDFERARGNLAVADAMLASPGSSSEDE